MRYFEKTLDLIDAHNQQYINKESSYTVDLNQYSDLFDEEKKKQLTGALVNRSLLKKRAIKYKDLYREWFVGDKNVTVRSSNDYRRFFNTTVESQGSCGYVYIILLLTEFNFSRILLFFFKELLVKFIQINSLKV